MSIDGFLEQIKRRFSDQQARVLVSAFRHHDPAWRWLESSEHQKSWLDFSGENLALWHPGTLAIFALDPNLAAQDLTDFDTPVPEALLADARQTLETLLLTGLESGSVQDAGLLALLLRDQRRQHGSWQSAPVFLLQAKRNLSVWRNALACLPALIPDYEALVGNLLHSLADEFQLSLLDMLAFSLACQPIDSQQRMRISSTQFSNATLRQQTAFLQAMSDYEDAAFIRFLATQFLGNYSAQGKISFPQSASSSPSGQSVEDFQQLALLSQLAGQPQQVNTAVQKALEAFNLNQAALLKKLALDLEAHNPEEARQTWEEVLRLVPADQAYRRQYAEFLIALEDTENGLALLNEPGDEPIRQLYALRHQHLRQMIDFNEERLLEALKTSDPNDRHSRFVPHSDAFLAAQFAFEKKNYEMAETFINQVLAEQPNDLEALKLASEINRHLANVDKAIESTALAAMFEPQNDDTAMDLVHLFLQKQQPERAFEIFDRKIKATADPARPDLLTYADLAIQSSKPEIAIPIAKTFLTHDNLDGEALVILCKALMASGEEPAARELLESTAALAPDRPSSWLTLAEIWTAFGESEKALQSLRKAQAALPNDPDILGRLGELYLQNDQPTEAIAVLKQAHPLRPDDVTICRNLAAAYLEHGYIDSAWAVISPLEADFTSDPKLALVLGQVLAELGDAHNARKMLKFAWQASSSQTALLEYAKLLLKKLDGQPKLLPADRKELAAIQDSLSTAPDSVFFDLKVLAADIDAALGNAADAYASYIKLLNQPEAKTTRNYQHLQLQTGKTALALEMYEVSLAALQEAVLVDPDDLRTRQILAEGLRTAGLREESEAAANTALQMAPAQLENVLWFSRFASESSNPRAGIKVLQDAVQLRPDDRSLYLALAQAQINSSEQDAARETLQQLLSLEDISTEEFIRAADIFQHMQLPDEALRVIKQAVLSNPMPDFAESRDLVYTIMSLGDLETATNLLKDLENTHARQPAFALLRSDLLTGAKKFIPARQSLESLLRQLEFSPEESAFDALPPLQADLNIPDYSRAGVFCRAAQLDFLVGDFNSARKYVGLALAAEPASSRYKLLKLELDFSLQDTSALDSALRSLSEAEAGSPFPSNAARLLTLQSLLEENTAKTALLRDNFFAKEDASPIAKALQALSANQQGLAEEAQQVLQEAVEALGAESALHPSAFNPSNHFQWLWQAFLLAWTAWKLENWQLADDLFQQVLEIVKVNPVVNKTFAAYLVDRTRVLRNSAKLHIKVHAPQDQPTELFGSPTFDQQLSVAGRYLPAMQLIPLLKVGQAVFAQSWPEGQDPVPLLQNAFLAAQALSVSDDPTWSQQIWAAFAADPRVIFQQALNLLETQPAESSRLAAKLIETQAHFAPYQTLLALAVHNSGGEGWQRMEQALHYWPEESDWHTLAAEMYLEGGKFAEAAAHVEQALQLEPQNAAYWQTLGDIKVLEKDYQAARDYFTKASDLFPENPAALESLATINRRLGENQAAIQCLQKAFSLQPENLGLLEALAEVHLTRQDYPNALATAGKVLQAEPTRQRALKVKVETLICTRQYEEARQLILRALDQADDAVPFELLNLKLDAAVSHKSVLPAAERLAQAYPDRVEVLNTLAASQLENDQLPQAEKTLQKSYLLNPDDPQTLLAMGHIDRIQGNLDQALAHLSQAVQLDPSLIDAYLELGLTYQTRREVNKALETYHRAIQMVPKDARAYVQAAAAYKDSRDYHSAELMLREAAQISNNNPSIRRQLASVMALNLVNNLQEAPKRK